MSAPAAAARAELRSAPAAAAPAERSAPAVVARAERSAPAPAARPAAGPFTRPRVEPGGAVVDLAVRRSARTLHAACAELLPGYAAASREPWRQALLTAGCLDGPPVRPAPRRPAPPLIVEDVVQPSDVLCALWLARRSGLFSAGSVCGDGVGRRSACEIVPDFAAGVSARSRDEVWQVLSTNTAWRAHRAARLAA